MHSTTLSLSLSLTSNAFAVGDEDINRNVTNLQTSNPSQDQDVDISGTHLVIIPGQNGLGGQNVDNYIAIPKSRHHWVETPNFPLIDLGQFQCISLLKNAVDPLLEDDKVKKIIFHASSQGTATLLNFLGSRHHEKFAAVVLEAVLSSGSHAILHTCNEGIFPGIKNRPFARFGLPHLARCLFPLYLPGMLEPIHSVSKIQSGLPFFIMHCKKDFQLSVEGAIGIHGGLLSKGNPSFLSIKPGRGHVLMLDSGDEIGNKVNGFFAENSLPTTLLWSKDNSKSNNTTKDEDAKKVYAKLVKENNQEFLFGACVNIAIVGFLLKLIASFVL